MRFINYLLDREVSVRTTNRLFFASSNPRGQGAARTNPSNPAIYPPDSAFERLEWMYDSGEAIRLYDRAWTELKLH